MKHLIFTRFNIRQHFGASPKKLGKPSPNYDILGDDYLSYRLDLFEKNIYRCLQEQTCKGFVWYVFFHDETPQHWRDYISKLEAHFDSFRPVYLPEDNSPSGTDLIGAIAHILGDEVPEGSGPLLTTRIDNDDLVAPDFIEGLQEAVKKEPESCILTYPLGLSYLASKQYATYMPYPLNHFISLLSEAHGEQSEHVLLWEHGKIQSDSGYPLIQIKPDEPMWVEYIHKNNYANIQWYKPETLIMDYSEAARYSKRFGYELRPTEAYAYQKRMKKLGLVFPVFRKVHSAIWLANKKSFSHRR